MNRFYIFSFLNKNFPDFDAENPLHLQRAEKLLKAEQKTNTFLTPQETESAIAFFLNFGNRFDQFTKDERFLKTFLDQSSALTTYQKYLGSFNENICSEFGNIFENEIGSFISSNPMNFPKMQHFYRNYNLIINHVNKEKLYQIYDAKLQNIYTVLQQQNFRVLMQEYRFSIDKNFYRLLSTIDSAHFEKKVVQVVASQSKTSNKKDKIIHGNILVAASSFLSDSREVMEYLKARASVGFLAKMDEETLFSAKESRLLKEWVENEDHWTDILKIFLVYTLLFGSLYGMYYYFPIYVILFIAMMSFLCLFAFYKAPNNWGVEEIDTSQYSWIRKFKKINLDFYIIFLYVGMVVGFGSVFIGILMLIVWWIT